MIQSLGMEGEVAIRVRNRPLAEALAGPELLSYEKATRMRHAKGRSNVLGCQSQNLQTAESQSGYLRMSNFSMTWP
jgi:hypothetical protein